jgi:beta-galactosidase
VDVEVYSDADEVELILNGNSLGRQPAGPNAEYRARFQVGYEPGELVAVAYRGGVASERTSLRSATAARLTATADRSMLRSDGGDLAYISIEFVDPDGIRDTSEDHLVQVTVDGAGVLQALGSARPASDEPFHSSSCTTFDGRAIAIIRPTGPGEIIVTVACEGSAPAITRLQVT